MTRRTVVIAMTVTIALAIGIAAWWWRGQDSSRAASGSRSPATVETSRELATRVRGGRRVIFIGLDGADWSLLDSYSKNGTMPALARLVREGTSGTLATLHPPLSPLVWTSMLTGTSPLEHRVLDFLRVNPATHEREPITSDERQVPAIWNMATAAGKRVASLGFWATYPAEPVNGLMVSDRLFTFLYSESAPPPGVVYPADLQDWSIEGLRRAQASADYPAMKAMLPWLDRAQYEQAAAITDPYAHPVSALRRILIETEVYSDLGLRSFAEHTPDLLLVYIQGTDSIGHVFAPYAPPRQPSVSAEDFARYSAVPAHYFTQIDRLLEKYRALAESTGSVLMLGSDHGFTWSEGRPAGLSSVANATAARWHAENGMYLLWGNGIPATNGHTGHGSVQQLCATLLALTGLPPGTDVLGPPLPGTPSSSAGEPFDYRQHFTPMAAIAGAGSAEQSRVDEDTVARLRALGYIGAAETTGRSAGTRTAGSFNNEGVLLRAAGKTQEAIDAFDNAISVDPGLASALWNFSDLLFTQNALDKSDTLLVRAYAHDLPEGRRYLIGRAIGYQRNGDISRSVRLLNQAAAAKPDDPEVLLFRGRYRVEAGDCAGAVADMRRATELAPANSAAFASLGLAETCAGDLAAAQRSFRHSLELDPNQPQLRQYLQKTPRG
jgi:type I phosphodiesterase/nucleotide pyrophosphatase/tetratricopeptide repeat protein